VLEITYSISLMEHDICDISALTEVVDSVFFLESRQSSIEK